MGNTMLSMGHQNQWTLSNNQKYFLTRKASFGEDL